VLNCIESVFLLVSLAGLWIVSEKSNIYHGIVISWNSNIMVTKIQIFAVSCLN